MQEPMTDFLRRHGFRHLRDIDRGAIWTNGHGKVGVAKSYEKDPAAEKQVTETIRRLAREKAIKDAAEKTKFEKAVEKKQNATFADAVIKAWPTVTPEELKELSEPKKKEAPKESAAERDREVLLRRDEKVAVPKKELPPPMGKLPRIVMKILMDEDLTAAKKVKLIMAWANDDEDEE